MKKKYAVIVAYDCTRSKTINVLADSEEDAEALALEAAPKSGAFQYDDGNEPEFYTTGVTEI